MIVLLPIARFKVTYEVASGRPFSQFERCVLEAVENGIATLDDLHKLFLVHRRVVIEGLVTLMQAGWISLGSDGDFNITRAGRSALSVSSLLPPTLFVEPRADFVIMERIAGQLSHRSAVIYQDRRKLRPVQESALKMPSSDLPMNLEPSSVGPLLSRDRGEWIRWINSVSPVRRGGDFVVLSVDPEVGSIVGLPREWEDILTGEVIDYARRNAEKAPTLSSTQEKELAQLMPPQPEEPEINRFRWNLVDGDAHFEMLPLIDNALLLSDILASCDRHAVVLVNKLDYAACGTALEAIAAAISNGTVVDIVFGTTSSRSDADESAIDVIRKYVHSYAQQSRISPRLTFCRTSKIAMNGILLSTRSGSVFLSQSASIFGVERVARQIDLRHPGMIADICQIVADAVANEDSNPSSPPAVRLRTSASTMYSEMAKRSDSETEPSDGPTGEVLRGVRLRAAFNDILNRTESSVIIAAPDISSNTAPLFAKLGDLIKQRQISVIVNLAQDSQSIRPDVMEEFVKVGGAFSSRSRAATSWVLRDNKELIIGFGNWLTTTSFRSGFGPDTCVGFTGLTLSDSDLGFLWGGEDEVKL